MATLVHLAPEKDVAAIRRGGIRIGKGRRGVFAMPVLANSVVSHQWMRELKRNGQRVFYSAPFRIPDDEPVWCGHYGGPHEQVAAAEAAGRILRADTPLGMEIIVPRGIAAREIARIRQLPHVLGWRYYPEAHGRKPCGCPAYQWRGAIKSRKLREDYERSFDRGRRRCRCWKDSGVSTRRRRKSSATRSPVALSPAPKEWLCGGT